MGLLERVARAGGVHGTRGLTPDEVRRLLRSGDLVRVRRGVIALPSADPHLVLAARHGGVLSCSAAAAQHGMRVLRPVRRPHITVPDSRSGESPGVELHRRDVPADGWLTTRSRTVADCLRCLPAEEALVIADSALEGGCSRDEIAAHLTGRGAARPRALLGCADGRSQSTGETLVRFALLQAGHVLLPQVHVPGVGWVDGVIDGWLVIEVDGYEWHSSQAHLARDRRRDARLLELGYVVLRFTHRDVLDRLDDVIASILAVLMRHTTDS